MKSVCVLLSTYNGEKYLGEQLQSIYAQEDVSIHILARDDGSTDATREILNAYRKKNGHMELIEDCENLGPALSFMKLLYNSGDDYDYYAFADQDDIWKERKLIRAVEMIKDRDTPCLYASNQILYQDGVEKGLRFETPPKLGIVTALWKNELSGCTFVMNKKLRNILVREDARPSETCLRKRMHDSWVRAVAEVCGEIVYDHASYIDYRIHANNTVGVKKTSRLYRIRQEMNPETGNWRSALARELERFEIEDEQQARAVDAFARIDKAELLRNSYIRDNYVGKKTTFWLKTLLGWI